MMNVTNFSGFEIENYNHWSEVSEWDYPNFTPLEMSCTHTGRLVVARAYMEEIQRLRTYLGVPLSISSGYRDATHPIEAKKILNGGSPGSHNTGLAGDVHCYGELSYKILKCLGDFKFTGIGVNQKGGLHQRFIHLDMVPHTNPRPNLIRPNTWSY